jgi:hypothetical protein
MRQILYTCDVCGAEKKEANHWFIIFSHYPGTRLYKWSAADPTDEASNPPVRRELRQPQDHAANRRYA